jgi:hypothetical protein
MEKSRKIPDKNGDCSEDLQTISLALSLSKRHLSGESAQKVGAAMARIKAKLSEKCRG